MISFASIKNHHHHHHHPLLFCASPSNYNLHTRPLQMFSSGVIQYSTNLQILSIFMLFAKCFVRLLNSEPSDFNGGTPITEEFFIENISGRHNEDLCHILLSDWEIQRSRKFMEDKEAMFQRLVSEQLQPMKGLQKLRKWIEDAGLRRAAVTNAPISDAELLTSMLGLSDFFEILVIGNECDRATPFPDPYLKALQTLDISHKHAFVFRGLCFRDGSWDAGSRVRY